MPNMRCAEQGRWMTLCAAARPQRSEDGRAREARLDLYQGHLTNEEQEIGEDMKSSRG